MIGRHALVVVAILLGVVWGGRAVADNPAIQKAMAQKLKQELSKHRSEDTAWFNESEREHKISKTVFGREIVIARWSDEAKTWVWLDDPDSTLSVDVSRFTLKNGVVSFAVVAKGKAKAKAWAKVPNVVKGDVMATARVHIDLEGSCKIKEGKLAEAKITKLEGRISDFRPNNDLLKVIQGWLKDVANDYIKHNRDRYRTDLEKAINKTTF